MIRDALGLARTRREQEHRREKKKRFNYLVAELQGNSIRVGCAFDQHARRILGCRGQMKVLRRGERVRMHAWHSGGARKSETWTTSCRRVTIRLVRSRSVGPGIINSGLLLSSTRRILIN